MQLPGYALLVISLYLGFAKLDWMPHRWTDEGQVNVLPRETLLSRQLVWDVESDVAAPEKDC